MAEALDAVLSGGGRPRGDIILCSTASKRNARGILALLSKGYSADGSIYIHPAESGQGMKEVKSIASGMLQFRIHVTGKPPDTTEPGHTAFAHLGISAIEKAWHVTEALKTLDGVRGQRVHHAAIHEAVGRSTNLLVGNISCGNMARTTRIPIDCAIGVSITFPPGEELVNVQQEIMESIAAAAAQDSWLAEHPPTIDWLFGTQGVEVGTDHPLYRTLSRSILDVTGTAPFVNPLHSASDIRNPRLFSGIPTLGIGPLAGDLTQAGGHDEWVDVNDFVDSIKVCAKTMLDWCK